MSSQTLIKKRVMFISHSAAQNTGAEKCLLSFFKKIDRNKIEPVAVFPFDGPLKNASESLGVKSFIVPVRYWITSPIRYSDCREGLIDRCKDIAGLIKSEHIDIVHTNTSIFPEGAIAARMTETPHVWHLHEILDGHPWLKLLFPLGMAYRFMDITSDRVVVVSEALKKKVDNRISSEKVHLIHNGIESPKDGYDRGDLERKTGIPVYDPVVCTIGAIRKEKGYDTFLEAAAIVLKRKNAWFAIIGGTEDHDLESILKRRARELSIDGRVKFLNYREDAVQILNAIDIYVIPSLTESFGISCVEAMASGKPVVSTRCGGPEEIILEGTTGLLVEPNNPQQMAEAILTLIDNPEKSEEMGSEGKRRFEALFSEEVYCRRFEDLYLGICGGAGIRKTATIEFDNYFELLKNIEEKINLHMETVNSVFDTYSWKMTAPLRRFTGMINNLKFGKDG